MSQNNSNKIITAGFIEKPLRSINREFAGKISSFIQKNIKTEGTIESQELNTWLVHYGSFNHVLSETEIHTFEKKFTSIFSSYHDANIVKLLKRDLQGNRELKETFTIIGNFLQVYDQITTENIKEKLKELQVELPRIVNKSIKNNIVILWQIKDTYRFTFNGILPFEFSQSDLQTTEINLLDLIDKAIIFNFFSIWAETTVKFIQNTNNTLSGLFKLLMNNPKVKIDNEHENDLFTLYLRIIISKLSSLEQTIAVLNRIYSLHEVLKKELLKVANSELLDKIHLRELFETQNSISKVALQLLLSVEEKITYSKTHLNDYSKESVPAISLTEFKNRYHNLINLTSTIFLEGEKLKIWTDKYTDIPYYTFSSLLFFDIQNQKEILMGPEIILSAKGLFKNYNLGATTVYAIRGMSIDIRKGEFLVIFGTSGAGKTTLLNCLAGLDSPDKGVVYFKGKDLHKLNDRQKSELRLTEMGFIFQNYALLPHYTARENVTLPSDLAGLSIELKQRINDHLNGVGINLQSKQFPSQLSGGQMQRVGIARALTNKPTVIFADEPTGDLDSVTGKQVLDLLKKYHDETGTTIVVITHDESVAEYASRVVTVADGVITRDSLAN